MKHSVWAGACLALLIGAVGVGVFGPQPPSAQAAAQPQATLAATVFFTPDSDELTMAAKTQLDAVHRAYPKSPLQVVSIQGHADPAECTECGGPNDQYAVGLSHRRASNVRSYLVGGNIPDGVMVTQAFGGSKSKGKPAAQMRRVDIYFAADVDF